GAAGSGGVPDLLDPDASGGGATGPCKDLQLFCFDIFDMFIFNPDCFTCNNGDGCMDCVDFLAI
ncbi:MAG TPA: hypothetical protein VFG30_32885, partial [Polyangiales bacterium]|nr:hypothetical protein [Polyangiales bacterium]